MKVGAAGGYQVEAASELAVLSGIGWRMLAVEDLDALQPDIDQAFEKAGKFRSALRKPHGVSQRRHAATLMICWMPASSVGSSRSTEALASSAR